MADIVKHPALLEAMATAQFDEVFVGVETSGVEALRMMKKYQNISRDDPLFLERAVHTLQDCGFNVMAGFIVGADNEPENPFDPMIEFIQENGIPLAVVAPLTVLRGTDLYHRLHREGRLRGDTTGMNCELRFNYVPQVDPARLIDGYKRVLDTIYDAKLENYFERCLTLFKHLNRSRQSKTQWRPFRLRELPSLVRAVPREIPPAILVSALKFLLRVLLRHPKFLTEALALIAKGYHFRQVTEQFLLADAFEHCVNRELRAIVAELARRAVMRTREEQAELRVYLDERLAFIRAEYAKVHADFKYRTVRPVETFLRTIQEELRGLGVSVSIPTAL